MHKAKIPPDDPAPARIAAVLATHNGHINFTSQLTLTTNADANTSWH
jgi:hypothetical protein